MKKIIIFSLLICSGFCSAGILDGYKYVYVHPMTYEGQEGDRYGAQASVSNFLRESGFIVVSEGSSQYYDLKENPCLLLDVIINHESTTSGYSSVGYGWTEMLVTIKNCEEIVLYMEKGACENGGAVYDIISKCAKRALKKLDNKHRFNPGKSIKPKSGSVVFGECGTESLCLRALDKTMSEVSNIISSCGYDYKKIASKDSSSTIYDLQTQDNRIFYYFANSPFINDRNCNTIVIKDAIDNIGKWQSVFKSLCSSQADKYKMISDFNYKYYSVSGDARLTAFKIFLKRDLSTSLMTVEISMDI